MIFIDDVIITLPECGLVINVWVRSSRVSSIAVAFSRVIGVGVAITGIPRPERCPMMIITKWLHEWSVWLLVNLLYYQDNQINAMDTNLMFKEHHPQPIPIFVFSMLGLDWPRDWTRLLLRIHPQIMQIKVHGSHQHTLKHHLLLKTPLPPHHHSAGRVLALSWQCPLSIYIWNDSMVSINSTLCAVQVLLIWVTCCVLAWSWSGMSGQNFGYC